MQVLSTPEHRFQNLEDFDFDPHYAEVGGMRMHYLDEGLRNGEVVLCLHGNPSWSYLYRKMIPVFVAAGYRVLAPDLIGFGRSDKPIERGVHTYSNHVTWLADWFRQRDVACNLFCQDWGGLIGLRVVSQFPDRFRRVVAANTSLPEPFGTAADADRHRALYASLPVIKARDLRKYFEEPQEAPGFWYWRKFAAESAEFKLSYVLAGDTQSTPGSLTANDAPYPDEPYLAAPRAFPSMGPIFGDDPELQLNAEAWKVLESFGRPFQTAWATDEYVSTPKDEKAFQTRIPGARNVQHVKHESAGHFIAMPEAAEKMIEFMKAYPA